MGSREQQYVTVIGGANIDIHGKSRKTLVPKDSNSGTVRMSAGGVARNVAENLARLGVDCRLISVIGDDYHGQMLLRLCREAGMNMKFVHEISSAPTSTYLSVLDDAGDMQVAISDMSIIDLLNAERLQQHQAMLDQASLIILDTNLPNDALAWLTDTFDEITIFADTVSTAKAVRIKPFLSSIHTLKASALEAEALTGCEARTPGQLRNLADELHAEGYTNISGGLLDGVAEVKKRLDSPGPHHVILLTDGVANRGVWQPDALVDLTGRVAIVTGAGRGLGRTMARALAAAGADLMLASRTEEELLTLQAEIQEIGRKAEFHCTDVTDEDSCAGLVSETLKKLGRLDILVNNAGINIRKPVLELPFEEFERVQKTNLGGYFLCAKAAGAHLVGQGSGKVINISSIMGHVALPTQAAYASSKGAIEQLTKVMALE